MRAGISTASLFLKKNNEEGVALFDEWGVQTSEVFLSSFSEYTPAFGDKLRQNQGGLYINSVHALNEQFEPQLYSICPQVEKDAFTMLDGVMQVAKKVGAKYYTFHGVARVKRHGNYDNFAYLSPRTQKIYEFCQKYGVTLAYENVEWATYNRPSIFKALQGACPNLRGVLDVKQARISEYDYKEYIKDMGSALAYVHYSDVDANGNTCLAGKGVFDIEEMLKALCDYGFDGDILIENYAKDFTTLDELKQAYEYLQEKIYKIVK